MEKMSLGELLPEARSGSHASLIIHGLSADSREIQRGWLFFAIPGLHVDGHDFIPKALEQGAVAIVGQRPQDGLEVPYIQVDDVRFSLSFAAARWFDHPSDQLHLLGVTGTDGKSSTVYFTQQILESAGTSCGFFSTVAFKAEEQVEDNSFRQSTLEALELNTMLARMHKHGHSHGVIEATSHGLSHKTSRLRHIKFRGAAFTNLSHEHLEFHGSFEQYASDKANLFRELQADKNGRPPCAVLNAADGQARYMAEAARTAEAKVLFYQSFGPGTASRTSSMPELWADRLESDASGIRFMINQGEKSSPARIPLVGSFNVENILAALLLASYTLSKDPFDLLPHLSTLKSVKGRMLLVDEGQDFTVVVDYAHTPGAFQKVLPALKQGLKGRLLVVFGSGGERDTEKRPIQGSIAAEYAEVIVLSNEDPRLEDEWQILNDIKAGVDGSPNKPELHLIPDRHEAVFKACSLARPGDLVLLLGKGHEQSIIHPEGKRPYDEEQSARSALRRLDSMRKVVL